ncbi:TolB-like translocation protein [Algoriphagus litoralis]|uniref:PD40 domain-containing protein n=1 Tax=Algoriphagus litoralis TaxID=2202829 RepID=UPI000DB9EF71|nr:PD40 domain-containing protein [Algoriphagus litoralis]
MNTLKAKINRFAVFFLIVFGIFSLGGCHWFNAPKHRKAYFPSEVTAMESLNTPFNDYNMDIQILFHEMDVIFSSDRNSLPGSLQYDLIGITVSFAWDQQEGTLSMQEVSSSSAGVQMAKNLAQSTHTSFNERGPYSFGTPESGSYLLFSRDDQGFFTVYAKKFQIPYSVSTPQEIFPGESSFRILSESGNEMYPCLYGKAFEKVNNLGSRNRAEKLLLASDHEGSFNIYEIDLPENQEVMNFLQSEGLKQGKKLGINTEFQDQAPFISKSRMVFASDRPGGFGGFDLYYSDFDGQNWSMPKNMGPEINTEFDEFRPILDPAPYYENSILLFSSNRPGGLGGFDLYFVGVDKF